MVGMTLKLVYYIIITPCIKLGFFLPWFCGAFFEVRGTTCISHFVLTHCIL